MVDVPRAIKRTSTIRALPHKIFDEEDKGLRIDDQMEKDRQDAMNALYNAMHQNLDEQVEKK